MLFFRDSGLENFCAVKLNSTHVFIAGGYAKEYDLRDPFSESETGLRSGQINKPIGKINVPLKYRNGSC